jgi:hypothetical protein
LPRSFADGAEEVGCFTDGELDELQLTEERGRLAGCFADEELDDLQLTAKRPTGSRGGDV